MCPGCCLYWNALLYLVAQLVLDFFQWKSYGGILPSSFGQDVFSWHLEQSLGKPRKTFATEQEEAMPCVCAEAGYASVIGKSKLGYLKNMICMGHMAWPITSFDYNMTNKHVFSSFRPHLTALLLLQNCIIHS